MPASIPASIINGATGLDGRLKSIPFRRGIRGKGGLDPSFDIAVHGLRKLRSPRSTVRCSARSRMMSSRSKTFSARAGAGATAPPVRAGR